MPQLGGGVQLATLPLYMGFPMKGRDTLQDWDWEKGLGGRSPQLLCALSIWRGERLWLLWGEFLTTVGFCLLFSSAVSGALLVRAAIVLGHFHHLLVIDG